MAQAIMRPLTDNGQIQKTWADGSKTSDFAAQFIKPNKRLTSLKRLEIYNQQYWLRLINRLEEDFPGLQSLLGSEKFQALAIAYLQTFPPTTYSLNMLGSKLPEFLLKEPYWGDQHQELLLDIARFESAQAFTLNAEEKPALQAAALTDGDPMHLILTLQPHLVLLKLSYPADTFVSGIERLHAQRSEACISNNNHRLTPRQPIMPKRKKIYVAVFRADNSVYSRRLDPTAFALLELLKDGTPLGQACAVALADKLSGRDANKIGSRLKNWFQTWSESRWFCV